MLAFGLGVAGYAQYLPNARPSDVVFHALNLLALNFRVVEDVPVPWTLEVGRFLAHGVAATALVLAMATLARRQLDRRRATGWDEHVVVLGSASTAVDIASAYRKTNKKVVLVGAVADEDRERLQRDGVRLVAVADDELLADIVKDARRVIIAGDGDQDTVRLATRLRSVPSTPGRSTHLLVEQPALAGELRGSIRGTAQNVIDVCCVAERVASAVLQRFPPRREDALGPAPVVLGQGALGREIARRMVRGWYRPADPLRVLCLGPDRAAFVELREELMTFGRIEAPEVPWSVRAAVAQVVAHAAADRPTDTDLLRRDEHGPLVVLAGLDDATTFVLATKIVSKVSGVTVVALVDRSEGWTDLATDRGPGQRAVGADLHVLPARSMVVEPSVLETDRLRLLAHELFVDQQRWRDDVPSVFGSDVRGVERFDELSVTHRERFEKVAAVMPDAFDSAGLSVGSIDNPQILLLPEELLKIAEKLRSPAGHASGTEDDDYVWLEFVAQLPMVAARAGIDLVRVSEPALTLTDEDIELMARAAHEAYQVTQEVEGNLTGSQIAEQDWDELTEFAKESNRAQVRDITVKLAGVRRTLRPLEEAEPDRSWLTEDVVRRLAVWEHRRWEYLHRLAGYTYAQPTDHAARRHAMLVPWEDLSETQSLDVSAVMAIPDLLAGIGLDTCPLVADHRPAEPAEP